MLRIIVCVLFVFTLSSIALAQDPVKVDGNHYKVEFENDQVRVLRVKVGAGEKSIMHQHPDAVAIFMTDVNGKFTLSKRNFPGHHFKSRRGTLDTCNYPYAGKRWRPAI